MLFQIDMLFIYNNRGFWGGVKLIKLRKFLPTLAQVEAVSQPRMTPEGKAQADSKAQLKRV
jgi:hypothetical protein